MGVFVTVAQQPGCAPGLQLPCLGGLARLRARRRACKSASCAWPPGNEARVRFLGAQLLAAQGGRFWRDFTRRRVARAGSRGKVKPPRALPTGENRCLYSWRPCRCFFFLLLLGSPLPFLLLLRERPTVLVRWCPSLVPRLALSPFPRLGAALTLLRTGYRGDSVEAAVFFPFNFCCGGGAGPLPAGSASSSSRSTLFLTRSPNSDDDPEVKSTPKSFLPVHGDDVRVSVSFIAAHIVPFTIVSSRLLLA